MWECGAHLDGARGGVLVVGVVGEGFLGHDVVNVRQNVLESSLDVRGLQGGCFDE